MKRPLKHDTPEQKIYELEQINAELLEAIKLMVEQHNKNGQGITGACIKASQAIAKAEGRKENA